MLNNMSKRGLFEAKKEKKGNKIKKKEKELLPSILRSWSNKEILNAMIYKPIIEEKPERKDKTKTEEKTQ